MSVCARALSRYLAFDDVASQDSITETIESLIHSFNMKLIIVVVCFIGKSLHLFTPMTTPARRRHQLTGPENARSSGDTRLPFPSTRR
jgi:hypothetical protein